jgi:hypothetical protein
MESFRHSLDVVSKGFRMLNVEFRFSQLDLLLLLMFAIASFIHEGKEVLIHSWCTLVKGGSR